MKSMQKNHTHTHILINAQYGRHRLCRILLTDTMTGAGEAPAMGEWFLTTADSR